MSADESVPPAAGRLVSVSRAARRSARVVALIALLAAYPVVSGSFNGPGRVILAALVAIWLGGFVFFLGCERGDRF